MNIEYRLKKRKEAINELKELDENSRSVLIVHYSCESFYNVPEGRTPRITSIAVRYYKTCQTKSFSIHKVAEIKKIPMDRIEKEYDTLEKKMLEEYFEFVREHRSFYWIHWNMRDINYGFEAIENRYTVLGGNPIHIDNSYKFDLSRKLIDMYGSRYIEHPRLQKLIEKNNITKLDFLSGKEEASRFEDKNFVKLHQSTLRKVVIFQTVIERILNEELKTNASFKEIYGFSPQGLFHLINNYWWAKLACTIILLILGVIIGNIFIL